MNNTRTKMIKKGHFVLNLVSESIYLSIHPSIHLMFSIINWNVIIINDIILLLLLL